ncbi:MAG: flagellar export protein FliJ [Candidatus Eremiobacterota bacterium]
MPPKRFRYRLEKVLELKRKREEEEKEKLGKLLQEEAYEKQVKAQLEATLAQVQIELREKQREGSLNVNDLRFYPRHVKNLEDKIKYQELRLQELAIRIVEQRENLLKAAQERKMYEKHKEKSQEEWQAEMDHEEAKMIDELATIKFAREQATGQGQSED